VQPDPAIIQRLKEKIESDADLIAALNDYVATLEKCVAKQKERLEQLEPKPKATQAKAAQPQDPGPKGAHWTAVHEAGHALVARFFEWPVHKVQIEIGGSGMVSHCDPATLKDIPEAEQTPVSPGFYRTSMLIALSGPAANFLDNPQEFSRCAGNGCFRSDCSTFFEIAAKHLSLRGASNELWAATLANNTVGLNRLAREHRALWLEKPGTVPGEVWALYNEIFGEARQLLSANWAAVLRVAKALLEHGELDRAKIDELIGPEILGEQPEQDDAGGSV
jgi:hypothetical protein